MSDADIESDFRYDDDKDDVEDKHDLKHPLMARSQRRPQRKKNRFKRSKRKIAHCLLMSAMALIVLTVTGTLVYSFKTTSTDEAEYKSESESIKFKSILLWKNDYSWGFNSSSITSKDLNCSSSSKCLIRDRSSRFDFRDYDAIVLTAEDNISQILMQHSWQTNVLRVFANKATIIMNKTQNFVEQFNLTLTYRTDSDIVWNDFEVRTKEFGQRIAPALYPEWLDYDTRNLDEKYEKTNLEIIENRVKFAAIRICDKKSSVALVFDELKNYLLPPLIVDEFSCESLNPFDFAKIGNYKFFFAFEESLCTDNISDFFYAALRNHVIPVVLGGPIIYGNFAPPHSYIIAEKFSSIRELAEYLTQLDENPTEYLKYLWWTELYTIELAKSPLCQLCEILQDTKTFHNERWPKMSVKSNWWNRSRCQKTSSLISA